MNIYDRFPAHAEFPNVRFDTMVFEASLSNAITKIYNGRWLMPYKPRGRSRFTVRPNYTRSMLHDLRTELIHELIRISRIGSSKRHFTYVNKQYRICTELLAAGLVRSSKR